MNSSMWLQSDFEARYLATLRSNITGNAIRDHPWQVHRMQVAIELARGYSGKIYQQQIVRRPVLVVNNRTVRMNSDSAGAIEGLDAYTSHLRIDGHHGA